MDVEELTDLIANLIRDYDVIEQDLLEVATGSEEAYHRRGPGYITRDQNRIIVRTRDYKEFHIRVYPHAWSRRG